MTFIYTEPHPAEMFSASCSSLVTAWQYGAPRLHWQYWHHWPSEYTHDTSASKLKYLTSDSMANNVSLRYYVTTMSLNARQELFVQNLVAKGMNATAAYKAAGYEARNDGAVRADASRLLTNANVKIRVSELQREAAAKTVVTAESIAAELNAAYELAFANNQAAACVAASMGKAKLFGLIIDRQELRAEIRRPVADPDAPSEMSIDDWTKKYGGNVIEHQP